MDSSEQFNLAALTPFQLTLKVLSNSVPGRFSNTYFTLSYLNWLISSRACPLARQYQAASSQTRLQSWWALLPWWGRTQIRWQKTRRPYDPLLQRRYNMNGRSQMQGDKNWIFPKELNANEFFWDSHWLEIWKNHLCPSTGPTGGSVAMDSEVVRHDWEISNAGR